MSKIPSQLKGKLRERCISPIDSFESLGDVQRMKDGANVFIDNGAKVLAVAHLDTVLTGKPKLKRNVVRCPQLDDRLGVWVLLDLLPYLGCPAFDVLLTTNEERGDSTAQHFTSGKLYNWLFEFDRMGDDAVMYSYETEFMRSLVESFGWEVGFGSYTDICELEHLGCKGFNFAVGYHRQHTAHCFADLKDTYRSASRFCDFMSEMSDEHLPHEKREVWLIDDYQPLSRVGYQPLSRVGYHSRLDYCVECFCTVDELWNYCPFCGEQLTY